MVAEAEVVKAQDLPHSLRLAKVAVVMVRLAVQVRQQLE
jgi:hypothetical protein